MAWFTSWLMSIVTWAWRSYVAVTLWAWFVEPIGGAHVTTVRAMGIGLIVNLAVKQASFAEAEAQQRAKDKIGKGGFYVVEIVVGFAAPLLVLGFGWLYRHFL